MRHLILSFSNHFCSQGTVQELALLVATEHMEYIVGRSQYHLGALCQDH